MSGRGQVFSGELLLAYVIFTMVLVMVVYLWSSTVKDILESEDMYDIENTAMNMGEKLMKTPGSPEEWNASNVHAVGLVNASRSIEGSKVLDFLSLMDPEGGDNNCGGEISNYECNKHLAGAGMYDFYLEMEYLNGSTVSIDGYQCTTGKQPADDTRRITVTRTGLLNATIVKVQITVWR